MRILLLASLAAALLATLAAVVLNTFVQESAASAFSTSAVRL